MTRRLGLPKVALAVAMLGTLTACSGDQGATSESGGPRIAAIVLATANVYSQMNIEGIEKAVEEAGATVDILDGKFSGPAQLTAIQDAVATGRYQGLVVFPNDGAAVVPGVKLAAAEGIPVVAAYAPIGNSPDPLQPADGVIGTVWHPNAANGTELARLSIEACRTQHSGAAPCKVAYISGGNSIAFEQLKLDAFKKELATAGPSVALVAQQEGNFLAADARNATENILQAHPDINVITASGDEMALGAQLAAQDAGIEGISLMGNGGSVEGVKAVADGSWFACPIFLPVDEGYLATKMLLDKIAGVEPEQTVLDVVVATNSPQTVTADNVADFTAQWSLAG